MNRHMFLAVSILALVWSGAARAASDDPDTTKIVVTSTGLDMSSASGVEAFQRRIQNAAFKGCRESNGIDNSLAGQELFDDCVHQAFKAALASMPSPVQTARNSKAELAR